VPTGQRANASIVPLLAAAFAAVYAYFIIYGAMVQTEAFYICALLWSLERTLALSESLTPDSRPLIPALTLGLSLGVATLLRQSILPWVAVLFAWLLWQGYRGRNLRGALLAVSAAALTLALCVLPFTIRNYVAYGDFLLLNSNAGYAMYSAQHPLHGTSFQEYAAAPLPADIDGAAMNEATWDKALMARGIGFILAEPGRYLLLSLSRVRDYFVFWPTADSSLLFNLGRVLSFGIFLPFMLYGIVVEVKAKIKAKAEAEDEVKDEDEAEVEVGVEDEDKAEDEAEDEDEAEVGVDDEVKVEDEAEVKGRGGDTGIPLETLGGDKGSGEAWGGYFSTSALTLTLTFAFFYSALHIFTWAMSRYRLPVDAVLLIYAAAGVADLARRWGRRRREMA
jgi:hypothetical protein